MLTLNQIVSQITNLAAAHNQIAESGVGDFAEWQAKERSYPILWVFHESTSVNQMEIAFSIRLICADRVIVGEEGDNTEGHEQEVLSDTLLVLLDFLAYFQQNHSQPYNVVTSATIDPFTERLNDRLAGNSVTIQIRQPFDWNKCQIPQTGAAIPPSVDGITLYNFCDPSVVARLTDAQVTCLEAAICNPPTLCELIELATATQIVDCLSPEQESEVQDLVCDPCADATVTVNTAPFGTAPSGGNLNVPVVNGGANAVGSIIAGEVVIANNATFINGTQVTDQEAEVDANIFVTLDGTQSGTWNAGLQTWEVTGVACADANLEINGVQQETIASGATFNLIATLDGVAGGSYNAGTNTLSFTSNTGWQPDPNWPVLPSLTAADERFVGTLAVFENGYNVVTHRITAGAANINYGDGTSVISNGATQTKVYNYSTIAATVYTFQGRNVKYVKVDITRVGGAIASIALWDASSINATGGNNYVDMIGSLPNVTGDFVLSREPLSGTKAMTLLQRLRIKALGSNAASYRQSCIRGMNSLRVLEFPYSTLGQYNSFGNSSGQVDDLGDVNWGANTTMTTVFTGSRMKRHGNLTANSATTALDGYAQDCQRLEEFGTITATSATTLSGFFGGTTGSTVLTRVGLITAPLCQNLNTFAFRCYSLRELIFSDCAAVTSTTNMVLQCVSLFNASMPNLTRGVNFAGTAMGNYGMNNFANSIGTATGSQTITVTGTPFGALLTALDATALAIRLVMTGKGYTVAN